MIQTEDAVEVLQAEGESGAETVGFSTFGAQRINDAQKRRCRPTSVVFVWNKTTIPAQLTMPTPAAYWGTFITTFDGTVLAGARNDGVGAATAGWASGNLFDPATRYSDGLGGSTSLGTLTGTTLGLPAGRCGFDIFINLFETDVTSSLEYWNPYTNAVLSQPLIVGKAPQIQQFTMAGAPAGTPPFLIVRRRPEGYQANEDGAQVFITLPYASLAVPAGFVNPLAVGVPANAFDTKVSVNIFP